MRFSKANKMINKAVTPILMAINRLQSNKILLVKKKKDVVNPALKETMNARKMHHKHGLIGLTINPHLSSSKLTNTF